MDQHTLPSEWRRQQAITQRVLRHPNPKKMGWWRGATFKEYIREELATYSRNMSRDMKHKFDFVNIAGNSFTEIPHSTLHIIKLEE